MSARSHSREPEQEESTFEEPPPRYSIVIKDDIPPPFIPPICGSASTTTPRSRGSSPHISATPEKQRPSTPTHLYIHRQDNHHFTILDSERADVLYRVALHHVPFISNKYTVEVRSGNTEGPVIGSSTFDTLAHTMTLSLRHYPIMVQRNSPSFTANEVFQFGLTVGDPHILTWESQDVAKGFDLTLIQDQADRRQLARIQSSEAKAPDDEVRLELADSTMEKLTLDKIVVSGMAMLFFVQNRKNQRSVYGHNQWGEITHITVDSRR